MFLESVFSKRRDPAFDAEMLPHVAVVFDVALRLSGSHNDAQDLAQETFLRAFTFFDKFVLGTSAKAWLLTILRNCHKNRLRRGARHPEDDLDEEQIGVPIGDEPPDWSSITSSDLDAAIAALPLKLREVIVLRELHDLSYKEIAAVLVCPVGTVMSRLHRARAELRQALQQHLDAAQKRGVL